MRAVIFVATITVAATAATTLCGQTTFDPHDFSGHWDRGSPLESFSNTPGGTRNFELPQSREAPLTEAGRARFDANKPGYGPRRQMERNDPLGRCEPMGLVRNLNVEIVAPHATFELVQTPRRILQFFEYRHDWREIWMDGRSLPGPDEFYPKWNGYSVGRIEDDTLVVESVGFDDRSWLDKLGYPHSELMHVEERYRRLDAETLELTVTITDQQIYSEPWVSDTKRFELNRAKAQSWDEQIYCIPAEETSYQQLIGTGNVID